MNEQPTDVKLLSPLEYLARAVELIDQATSRIYLIGMTIFRDDTTRELIDAISRAARRGVNVHVAADFMTFTYAISGLKTFPLTYRSRSIREMANLKKQFSHDGVKFRWLGQHSGPMFTGRTHSKWLVVDDVAFSFGGINTEKEAFVDHIDYMLEFRDAHLANLLAAEHEKIEAADRARTSSRNHRARIRDGLVLFDGGKAGRSIIYNAAVKLANEASEILLVSQYCPTGKLAKILATKPSRIYFNQLENVDKLLNRMMIRLGKSAIREHNLYHHETYLHAKFAIFTMPDGTKTAITGSYNFVALSGRLGQREVALATSNPQIISLLEKFWRENVK